ncbi:LLM class flavin-dependent oxidoreductase [Microbacterium sediminicola]|uniref:LLM class flavin-dependent oxidoreductase n=1 Tax=Microbacterium sediminicola TaxID=415210 RepID=A0ABP4TH96_9MICO
MSTTDTAIGRLRLGLFCAPFRMPENTLADAHEWDLQVLKWADALGFDEAWIGEHYTLGWEPLPAPDLLIAAALRETEHIRLGPAAHLLPYHHPAELAARIAWLDNVARGRYMVAFGAGSYRTDQELFGSSGPHDNAERTREAQEIMLGLWRSWARREPFEFTGRFWSVGSPDYDPLVAGPHLAPYSGNHPEVAVVGASPSSASLRRAGGQGFIPLTVVHSPDYAAKHWDVYQEGALEAGRPADRAVWRVCHPLFVADSDELAWERSMGGAMGRTYRDWILPHAASRGTLPHFAPEIAATGEVTLERLAEKWLVGSPDTVADGILRLYRHTGGFGVLLVSAYDYSADPEAYRRSLELLATEVIPRVEAQL